MLLYVVTYDISCNKRRKKVSDLLEGYGKRVQYSVFECVLPVTKYEQLCQRLKRIIKVEADSVRFYPLSGHTLSKIIVWGEPPVTSLPESIVV